MKNKTIAFSLYSNCVLMDGYQKTILCDFFRARFFELTKKESMFLQKYLKMPILDIRKSTNNDEYEKLMSIFSFLENNDLGMFIETDELMYFCEYDKNILSPSTYTNTLIYYSSESNYKLENALLKIQQLGCPCVHIVLHESINIFDFIKLLNQVTIHSSLEFIEITHNVTFVPLRKTILQLRRNNRIQNIFVKKIASEIPMYVKTSIVEINSEQYCTFYNGKKSFHVSMDLYFESLNHNAYYYKKLVINEEGCIVYI